MSSKVDHNLMHNVKCKLVCDLVYVYSTHCEHWLRTLLINTY